MLAAWFLILRFCQSLPLLTLLTYGSLQAQETPQVPEFRQSLNDYLDQLKQHSEFFREVTFRYFIDGKEVIDPENHYFDLRYNTVRFSVSQSERNVKGEPPKELELHILSKPASEYFQEGSDF